MDATTSVSANLAFQTIAGRFRTRFPFWLVFICFACLWVAQFWPGLRHAWWSADDYWAAQWDSSQRWGDFVLGDGRPLLGVWSYTFLLDNTADKYAANIVLRSIQGAVHVLSATLIARLLWSVARSPVVVLTVLPFLLWPFNADAVLWRAGSLYAIATLLAVIGLSAIRSRPAKFSWIYWTGGAVLCGSSMLAIQPAAFASVLVFIVVAMLAVIEEQDVPWRRLSREALFVAAGVVVGAAISLWLIKTHPHADRNWNRSQLAFNWRDKYAFLLQLNRTVLFFPGFYPWYLQAVHAAFAISAFAGVASLGVATVSQGIARSRAALVLLALASCLVVPYSAQLVVGESLPFLRTMYLGPLILTAFGVAAFAATRRYRWIRFVVTLLPVVAAVMYWPIAWVHSGEYVQAYHGDLRQLRAAEDAARDLGLTRVMVMRRTPFYRYNPFGLKYTYYATKNPALSNAYGLAELFIRNRSWLQPICRPVDGLTCVQCEVDIDDVIRDRAREQRLVSLRASSEPQFRRIDKYDVMAIFMP
jgi:hypothetical protein